MGGGQFAEHTLNEWVKQICFKRLNLKFHIYCLVIFDGLNLLHGFAWRQDLLVNLHFSLNCQIIGLNSISAINHYNLQKISKVTQDLKLRIIFTFYVRVVPRYLIHTWASSKSPGEGVQFFFSRPDFSKQGGARGGPFKKFLLNFIG